MKNITERHLTHLNDYLLKIKSKLQRAQNFRLVVGAIWLSLLVAAAAYPNAILTLLAAIVFPIVFATNANLVLRSVVPAVIEPLFCVYLSPKCAIAFERLSAIS